MYNILNICDLIYVWMITFYLIYSMFLFSMLFSIYGIVKFFAWEFNVFVLYAIYGIVKFFALA